MVKKSCFFNSIFYIQIVLHNFWIVEKKRFIYESRHTRRKVKERFREGGYFIASFIAFLSHYIPLLFQGLTRTVLSPNDSIYTMLHRETTRRSRFIITTAREANLDREFRNCYTQRSVASAWAWKQAELSKAFVTGETLH